MICGDGWKLLFTGEEDDYQDRSRYDTRAYASHFDLSSYTEDATSSPTHGKKFPILTSLAGGDEPHTHHSRN